MKAGAHDYAARRRLAQVVYSRGDAGSHVASLKRGLARTGYLLHAVCDCPEDHFCLHTERAVWLFQTFVRLPASGRIDLATLKLLSSKRCSMADVAPGVARAVGELGPEGIDAQDPFVFNFNS